jgi:nicotinamide riboside transporter PnuC
VDRAGAGRAGHLLICAQRLTDSTNNRNSPFVVGVSGHRDLHPDTLEALRGEVTRFLEALKSHLPDTELRVMAGMAAGADLLVVRTALDLGLGVDAVLPMPLAQYAADFEPEALASLNTLLDHPQLRCRELPLAEAAQPGAAGAGARDRHYSKLSRSLIRGSSLLLTLWDGQPSPLPAGTADTVLRYLGVRTDRNRDDLHLQFADAAADQEDLPAKFVYWIPSARARSNPPPDGRSPCYLAGLGDNALLRLPAMPRRLEIHLRSLNIYNREYQRYLDRWPGPAAPDSLLGTLPAALALEPREMPALARIDAQYGKADALAMYFQKRSDQLFAFLNLVAFAMGLAYLTYEKFMSTRVLLLLYLVILVSSVGLYRVRHWFAKHLMCRALAETLRVKFYLRLAHGDHLVDAEEMLSLSSVNRFHGFGWIGHVLTAVEAPALDEAWAAQAAGSAADGVDLAWIENQCRYFTRKVAQLRRNSERTKWLKRILFGILLAVILVLLLLGESAANHRLFGSGVPLERALTFVIGVVAVLLASWELHQNKMASRELLWQYRNQLKHFSRARAQLSRTFAAGRRLEVLAELGKDSLMEGYLWTIHRFHREHEPPGRG